MKRHGRRLEGDEALCRARGGKGETEDNVLGTFDARGVIHRAHRPVEISATKQCYHLYKYGVDRRGMEGPREVEAQFHHDS